MVNALIIAGGSGKRTGHNVPKQFMNVYDKPIIVYTLEAFQKHTDVTAITVVCLNGWQDFLQAYCLQYGISKLISIVPGGNNGQNSIFRGITDIATRCIENDLVIVHEAVRPLVSESVITDSIRVCKEHGGAVAAVPCNDAMLLVKSLSTAEAHISRSTLMKAQNPHTFTLGKLLWAHNEADRLGIVDTVATSTLMIELGETLHLSEGADMNFKITSNEELEIFKAILSSNVV